jgi:hypothetical protein
LNNELNRSTWNKIFSVPSRSTWNVIVPNLSLRHHRFRLYNSGVSGLRPSQCVAVFGSRRRSAAMETCNAFIGHPAQPTAQEIGSVLGSAADAWNQFIDWLAKEHGVVDREWRSFSPKYGWTLLLKLKKRTIVHLGPCVGAFHAVFILGDRAVAAAKGSRLPKTILKPLEEARRYTEGTGVRFTVRKPAELAGIRRLAEIKLAN